MASPTQTLSEEAILTELRDLRDEIGVFEAKLAACYARRAELFVTARSRDPRVVQSRLAEAAGVSDAAVIRVLRANGVTSR